MAVPIPQISNYVDLGEQLRQKWERERQQKLQDEQNAWARQDRALKLQKIAQEEMARKKFQQAIQPSPLAPFANMVSPLVGMISPDAQKNLMGAMQPSDQQMLSAGRDYAVSAGKDPTEIIDWQMKMNQAANRTQGNARTLLDRQKAQQQFMTFASKSPREVSMWPDAQLLSMGIAPENIPQIRIALSGMADIQDKKREEMQGNKINLSPIENQLLQMPADDPRRPMFEKLVQEKMTNLRPLATSEGYSTFNPKTGGVTPLVENHSMPMGGGVGSPETVPSPTDVTTAGMPAAYEIPPQNAPEPTTASGPTDIAPVPTSNAPVDFNMPTLGEPALPGGPKRVMPPVKAPTKASEVPEGLSEVQKLRFATQWGNSFEKLTNRHKVIEETALPIHQAVQLLRTTGPNNPTAQELVKVLWSKVTDPTTGVREGEFNRDARFKSAADSLVSFLGATLKGESFLPHQLDQMDEAVNILQNTAKSMYDQNKKQYQERFTEIDPTGHLGSVFLGAPETASPAAALQKPVANASVTADLLKQAEADWMGGVK